MIIDMSIIILIQVCMIICMFVCMNMIIYVIIFIFIVIYIFICLKGTMLKAAEIHVSAAFGSCRFLIFKKRTS